MYVCGLDSLEFGMCYILEYKSEREMVGEYESVCGREGGGGGDYVNMYVGLFGMYIGVWIWMVLLFMVFFGDVE